MTKWSAWCRNTRYMYLGLAVSENVSTNANSLIYICDISMCTWIRLDFSFCSSTMLIHILCWPSMATIGRIDGDKRQPPLTRDIGWVVKYIHVWVFVRVSASWGTPRNTSEGIAILVYHFCTPSLPYFRSIYKQYIKIEQEYMVCYLEK